MPVTVNLKKKKKKKEIYPNKHFVTRGIPRVIALESPSIFAVWVRYPIMNQVQFVEAAFEKFEVIWSVKLSPFLNTLSNTCHFHEHVAYSSKDHSTR